MDKELYCAPSCECRFIKLEGILAASNEGNQGIEYD